MRAKLVLFLIGVLVGATPLAYQYWQLKQQAETAQSRVLDLEQRLRLAELRTQLGTIIFEAQNQNFGRARDLSTEFFNDLSQAASSVEDATVQQQLQGILQRRDEFTADLTSLSPQAAAKLWDVYRNFPQLPRAAPTPAM
jgi:preprotein translocase subunit SecF